MTSSIMMVFDFCYCDDDAVSGVSCSFGQGKSGK